LPSILLSGGTPISWDGNPWKILNVGISEVCLEDPQHQICTLPLCEFQQLVAGGAILGIPLESDLRNDFVAEKLRHASPADLALAVHRIRCLEEDADPHISARTFRKWRKCADEAESAYGNRFAGLVARISARGNRLRKVSAEVINVMQQVIDTEVLTAFQPKIGVCYGLVRNLCAERGLLAPSEKTFRAEIKLRREEAITLAREGNRAAYGVTEFQWNVDQSTPRHGERPFEIGHIDHTELDEELVDSRTGANLRRPWLTVLLDAYTRMVLGYYLSFDPPSYRSCMAVIRNTIQRHGRIPKYIVVDRGSDFQSAYFEALLAQLGANKKSRPTAKSRFGSVIERFFGVNNQAFIHNLVGNSQALQRPRSMSPSHDPRKLAVWTLPALTQAFEGFVDNVYANLSHPALGRSPKEAMARGLAMSGVRKHLLIPFTDDFKRQCMPTTPAGKAVVRSGRGIKIKGVYYWHPSFREPKVARTKVPLRYDPFDASRAYALVGGEWVLCRSEYQALFERRTEREIAVISQEIRMLHSLADARRGVNAAQIAAYIGQARETERVLLQQRRDAERRCAESGDCAETVPVPVPPPIAEDIWTGPIVVADFEELK
jgi:transposase InsO family protein